MMIAGGELPRHSGWPAGADRTSGIAPPLEFGPPEYLVFNRGAVVYNRRGQSSSVPWIGSGGPSSSRKSKRSKHTRKTRPSRRATAPKAARAAGASPARPGGGTKTLAFDPKTLMKLYLERRHEELSEQLLAALEPFRREAPVSLAPAEQNFIDMVSESLLYYFTKPDFILPAKHAERYILLLPVIANVVAGSRFGTTDPQVRILMDQPGNFIKLLTLYSARNTVKLDARRFFDVDPYYTSIWYGTYFDNESMATPTLYENLRAHLESVDDRYQLGNLGATVTSAAFLGTYIKPESEKLLRTKINLAVAEACRAVTIRNQPNPRSIAIVSGGWHPNTHVYRNMHPYVAALAEGYDLTLVHLGPPSDVLDTGLFKQVKRVHFDGRALYITEIEDNDFQVAYFAEVGMSLESRLISNLRLAPIQATGYGHPVSTCSPVMDYFLGGVEAEDLDGAEQRFTERLVLLPGTASHPIYGGEDFEPTDPSRLVSLPDVGVHRRYAEYVRQNPPKDIDAVVVNAPWSVMKYTYPMLQALREILRQARSNVVFRFLAGSTASRRFALLSLRLDVEAALGPPHMRMAGRMPRGEYLRTLEMGDLSIDSFPFGGYNTIFDSLFLGKPVVTWQGATFYNRAASALLRRIGLGELVATNAQEYVTKVVRLIDDPAYRDEIRQRLAEANLMDAVFNFQEWRVLPQGDGLPHRQPPAAPGRGDADADIHHLSYIPRARAQEAP